MSDNGARPRVLVIDDNEEFLSITHDVLSDALGFEVEVASTGSQGVSLLETRDPVPAFVVLDFRLPDGHAPEFLARIRNNRRLANVPILVVSQGDWLADRELAMANGAQDMAIKPSLVAPLRDLLLSFWRSHG